MSKTKGGGSTRNGRDSTSKRLGVKVFDGGQVQAGAIIVRREMPDGRVYGSTSVTLVALAADGRLRYDALQNWLGGGGVPSTKFPLIGSLPSIPLILLGHVVASPEWWVARYNVLVYAAGIGLLYALLRDHIATDLLGAFLVLLGTTAMLPNSLTGFGVETFTAMAVGTGLVAWSVGRWQTGAVLIGTHW